MKEYKFCQSCGMPMKKDPQGGGSKVDGTKSSMYCSYCYQGGQFTWPDATVEQMRTFCIDKMVEMKFPRFLAKLMTMGMPKLERWKKASS